MTLTVFPVPGIPQVRAGDDLAALVARALRRCHLPLADGDVLVVSSKVVSKALGLTAPAQDKATVVAGESERVVAERVTAGGLSRVVAARAGPVMAAAGVDASNTGGDHLLLLPRDPDTVCRELHSRLCAAFGVRRLGVILSDTAGRPWRIGQTDFALGAYGVEVVEDLRGTVDADGRGLEVTTRAVADELAAAADLVKGKARAIPVALVRGLPAGARAPAGLDGARSLVRQGPGDWFSYGSAEAVRAALGVEPGSELAMGVGIASTSPEPTTTRVARAVAVAIHAAADVGVDVGPGRVVVTGPDAVDRGIAAARICVALWGEGLVGVVEDRDAAGADAVVVAVRASAGAGAEAGAASAPSGGRGVDAGLR